MLPALEGRCRRQGWRPVTRGVHLPASAPRELAGELAAWQLALPHAAGFTGLTGAAVRGWWLPSTPQPLPVFIALPHDSPRPRRPGLRVHRARRAGNLEVRNGLRLAPAVECLLAAARDLELLDLVQLVDAALASGDTTRAEIVARCGFGSHGSPMLRRALSHAEERTESAWEAALRILLRSCAVPVEPQYVVRTAAGDFLARGDLWIVGTRQLMEFDGAGHRDARQHAADLARDHGLLAEDWRRFGYVPEVILRRPQSILRDADRALGRAHDPRRLRRWFELLAGSGLSSAGRQRLVERWAPTGLGSLGPSETALARTK